ncbi:MAG TPA: redoxin domain-containing protein [Terracidiphilus sp.]
MQRLGWIFLIFYLASFQAYAAPPTDFGTDLRGQPVRRLAGSGVRVVVLFFAATDCPIANRYVPEIARLTKQYSAQGVHFWWVYPNPGETAQVVASHNRDYAITGDTILDPKLSLVARAHATVTPEAAVFLVQGGELREVYHGRIDDRYISLGQQRPQPEHHELETAITAALAGKPVPQPGGPPVGCSIVFLQ